MKRLEGIVSLIKPTESIVDIGSDHGYIAKMIADKKLAPRIYVTDVAVGPLSRARENLRDYCVETLLMDGLKGFKEDLDAAVVAGMGGELIIKIIDKSEALFSQMDYFILQPMQQISYLRRAMYERNYFLWEELLTFEDRFYEVLLYKKGRDTPYDFEYSKGLYSDKELYSDYLKEKQMKLHYILDVTKNTDLTRNKEIQLLLERLETHCKNNEIMLL
jgi:tRNA (adenine22-N1)-methyltransferase